MDNNMDTDSIRTNKKRKHIISIVVLLVLALIVAVVIVPKIVEKSQDMDIIEKYIASTTTQYGLTDASFEVQTDIIGNYSKIRVSNIFVTSNDFANLDDDTKLVFLQELAKINNRNRLHSLVNIYYLTSDGDKFKLNPSNSEILLKNGEEYYISRVEQDARLAKQIWEYCGNLAYASTLTGKRLDTYVYRQASEKFNLPVEEIERLYLLYHNSIG